MPSGQWSVARDGRHDQDEARCQISWKEAGTGAPSIVQAPSRKEQGEDRQGKGAPVVEVNAATLLYGVKQHRCTHGAELVGKHVRYVSTVRYCTCLTYLGHDGFEQIWQ